MTNAKQCRRRRRRRQSIHFASRPTLRMAIVGPCFYSNVFMFRLIIALDRARRADSEYMYVSLYKWIFRGVIGSQSFQNTLAPFNSRWGLCQFAKYLCIGNVAKNLKKKLTLLSAYSI